MKTILLICSIAVFSAHCEANPSDWPAPRHGGNGGKVYEFQCPNDGVITGIYGRNSSKLNQIGFTCSSSEGKTTFGPYGGSEGSKFTHDCPDGQYIRSIHGKSNDYVVSIGIRCRDPYMTDTWPRSEIIVYYPQYISESDGSLFDDDEYSFGFRRPEKIRVQAGLYVHAIQIIYGIKIPLITTCANCRSYQYEEVWADRHGQIHHFNNYRHKVYCPAEGVITGIKGRSGKGINQIQFICTSMLGNTIEGPFGGGGGKPFTIECPPGSFIGSIHGRSGERLQKLGIRCAKVGEEGGTIIAAHGVDRGPVFNDDSYATNGKRPVEIRVWSIHNHWDMAIQVKYGNLPVSLNCKVAKMEVTDKSIVAQEVGYQMIGVASGISCAPKDQQLTIQSAESVEESTGMDVTKGGEFNWATTVSLEYTFGFEAFGAKSEVSVGLSQTLGGSKSWSTTETKSVAIGSEQSLGTTITYEAPGACLAYGYLKQYKIERDNLPVRYHFSCEAGPTITKDGKINLKSKTFGHAHFQDVHFKFKSEEQCTQSAKSCVSALSAIKVASDPTSLEKDFYKCFPVSANDSTTCDVAVVSLFMCIFFLIFSLQNE